MATYGDDPEGYEDELQRYIDEIGADDLPHIFRSPGSSHLSHYIITIYSEEGHRGRFEKKFASRRVFELVWEKHLARRLDLMEELYNMFLASPITAIPAGWVFEDRMHQVLRTEGILRLFPIHPRRGETNVIFDDYAASKAGSNLTEFQLASSEEYPLVEGDGLVMNHYYRPESSNFAAVDSVLLIRPPSGSLILFMFQMTRNKAKPSTNLEGLWKVGGLGVPPGTRRYLVIVTPENIYPSITVPLEYFGGTVPIQVEETESGENEDVSKDQDEAMDEGEGEEKGKGDATGGAEWELFWVLHCPVDVGRLFQTVKP